jgi:DNA-binding response OmpR family regulator
VRLILIVEDDRDTNAAIQDVLESEAYACIPAFDGNDGFRLLVEDEPDLVLLDLELPGLSGEEFLKLKEEVSAVAEIPVVVITGFSHVPKLDRVVAMLPKPFTLEALLALARKHAPIDEAQTV